MIGYLKASSWGDILKIHLISSIFEFLDITKDYSSFKKNLMPPLGLASLTGFLRKNNLKVDQTDLSVEIIYDALFGNERSRINIKDLKNNKKIEDFLLGKGSKDIDKLAESLLAKIKLKNPDLVAFSVIYDRQLLPLLLLAKKIKERYETNICLGGHVLTSSFSTKLLNKFKFIDYCVLGEGELPLLCLCNYLEGNYRIDLIPNLVYRESGRIKINKTQGHFNYEDSPPPDFKGLPIDKYKKISNSKCVIYPYQFIRGCPFKCSFCRFCLQNKFYFKSPQKVVSDITEIIEKNNAKFLFFLNNTLNISENYVQELCKELNKVDILWSDSVRPAGLSPKTLNLMRKSGCIQLTFGLETVSSKQIKLLNKQFTIQEAKKVIMNSHKEGIWNGVNFILGLPYERYSDLRAIRRFINKNKEYMNKVSIYYFGLNEESEIFRHPEKFSVRIVKHPIHKVFVLDEIKGTPWWLKGLKNIVFTQLMINSLKKEDIQIMFESWKHNYIRQDIIYELYNKYNSKKDIIKIIKNRRI